MPIVPVAQNLQPILQPTCDETHSVLRPSWRIVTHSTRWPSRSSTTALVVAPFAALTRRSTRVHSGTVAPSTAARSAAARARVKSASHGSWKRSQLVASSAAPSPRAASSRIRAAAARQSAAACVRLISCASSSAKSASSSQIDGGPRSAKGAACPALWVGDEKSNQGQQGALQKQVQRVCSRRECAHEKMRACIALLLVAAAADECGFDAGSPSRSSADDGLAVAISTGDSDAALRLVNAVAAHMGGRAARGPPRRLLGRDARRAPPRRARVPVRARRAAHRQRERGAALARADVGARGARAPRGARWLVSTEEDTFWDLDAARALIDARDAAARARRRRRRRLRRRRRRGRRRRWRRWGSYGLSSCSTARCSRSSRTTRCSTAVRSELVSLLHGGASGRDRGRGASGRGARGRRRRRRMARAAGAMRPRRPARAPPEARRGVQQRPPPQLLRGIVPCARPASPSRPRSTRAHAGGPGRPGAAAASRRAALFFANPGRARARATRSRAPTTAGARCSTGPRACGATSASSRGTTPRASTCARCRSGGGSGRARRIEVEQSAAHVATAAFRTTAKGSERRRLELFARARIHDHRNAKAAFVLGLSPRTKMTQHGFQLCIALPFLVLDVGGFASSSCVAPLRRAHV